jgi:hypothetical protein
MKTVFVYVQDSSCLYKQTWKKYLTSVTWKVLKEQLHLSWDAKVDRITVCSKQCCCLEVCYQFYFVWLFINITLWWTLQHNFRHMSPCHLLLQSYAPVCNYNHLWLLTFIGTEFQALVFCVLGLIAFYWFSSYCGLVNSNAWQIIISTVLARTVEDNTGIRDHLVYSGCWKTHNFIMCCMRLEVFTVKIIVCWGEMLFSLVYSYQHFGGTRCLHLHGRRISWMWI